MPESTGQLYIPPSAQRALLEREALAAAGEGRGIRTQDGRELLVLDAADPLVKAMQEARAASVPYRVNPTLYSFGSYRGVKDLPQAMQTTVQILRQVPMRNPIVAAVIQRRKTQFSHYTRRPRFDGDTGFRIAMRDSKKHPTAQDRRRMKWIEDILVYGGIRMPHRRTGRMGAWNAEGSKRASGLALAFQMLMNDSLTLDAAAIEIQPGHMAQKHPVAYWEPVDAGFIRFAQAHDSGRDAIGGPSMWDQQYRPEIRPERDDIAFVKVDYGGIGVLAEYTDAEMAYLVRNPRTDEWTQGYGWSEIERLIDVIAGLLYGIQYNKEFFDNNHMPPGILNLRGSYNDTVLDSFRRQLHAMVGGVGQFHAMPIISSPDASGATYVPLREDASGGMYWKEWCLFCTAVIAALYGLDAGEINMANFGQSANALGNANPAEKVEQAQESGLESTLGRTGAWLDTDVVERIDPDFTFEWTGLQAEDGQTKMLESQYRLTMAMSNPNRELARLDERPIYDALDQPMWEALVEKVKATMDDEDLDPDEIEEQVVALYKKAGGQFARWPDAPVNNALAMQVWMAEHQIDPAAAGGAAPGQAGQDPNADPNDPNAQQGPPPTGFGQPGGVPPPAVGASPGVPLLAQGDRTHVADVGAMMLRGNQPPAPGPMQMRGKPMGKGLLHVTISREDLER